MKIKQLNDNYYCVIIHICHNNNILSLLILHFALIITTAITATPATVSRLRFLPFFFHHFSSLLLPLSSFFSSPSTSFLFLYSLPHPSNTQTVHQILDTVSPFPQLDTSLSLALCLPPDHAYRSLNVFPLCHALSGWLLHTILDDYCNIATLQPLIDISLPEAFFSRPFPSNADLTSHSTTTAPLFYS